MSRRRQWKAFFADVLYELNRPPSVRARLSVAPMGASQMNPELLRAEEELTEEHLALGERGAKELMHDRRRAQLDVYLICAAYRRNLPEVDDAASRGGWQLNEEDGRILDEMIREAAAMDSPWS